MSLSACCVRSHFGISPASWAGSNAVLHVHRGTYRPCSSSNNAARHGRVLQSAGFKTQSYLKAKMRKSKVEGGDIPFAHMGRTPPPPRLSREQLDSTTLTTTEREVFEAIFADIEKRGLRPKLPEAATTLEDDDIVFEGNSGVSSEVDSDLAHSLRDILDHASAQYDASSQLRSASGFERLSPMEQFKPALTDRAKLMMKYPKPLRRVAHKSLHFLDADTFDTHDNDNHQESGPSKEERAAAMKRSIQIEKTRKSLWATMEADMTSAASDIELWGVLERNVFSMISEMRLLDHQLNSDDGVDFDAKVAYKTPKAHKRVEASVKQLPLQNKHISMPDKTETTKARLLEIASSETAVAGDNEDLSVVRENVMSIRVHGPLYPRYIMLALKLLDTAFARSSPLALCLLPRVKELGVASFVLGVSSPFYNKLMRIYWERYGDVDAVLNLLKEMRAMGLHLDEQTIEILQHIMDRLDSYVGLSKNNSVEPHAGSFVRHVAHMREYDHFVKGHVGFWIREAERSVEQRIQLLGF